jgi:hypothetical protein
VENKDGRKIHSPARVVEQSQSMRVRINTA